jgi:hypothetical protein
VNLVKVSLPRRETLAGATTRRVKFLFSCHLNQAYRQYVDSDGLANSLASSYSPSLLGNFTSILDETIVVKLPKLNLGMGTRGWGLGTGDWGLGLGMGTG